MRERGFQMAGRTYRFGWTIAFVSILLQVSIAGAGIEDQVGVYSGNNAEGYLKPLAEAIGADLNNGLFRSSFIPISGFNVGFELHAMVMWFSDDDRTFRATTEGEFSPPASAEVPTVVGPGEGVSVTGEAGTTYMFPGGFNLSSFGLTVPQVRIGSYRGTEGIFRYMATDLEDSELGDLSLIGFGIRHSISQYLGPDFPLSVAGGFLWQRFKAGKNEAGGDLFRSTAWTIGFQAGKTYGGELATIEPYAGLSVDGHSADVAYESGSDEESSLVELSFDPDYSMRVTFGFLARLAVVGVRAEYSIGGRRSFGFGVALGKF
jgi:hypothetical protein